jgi:hypothetical protein
MDRDQKRLYPKVEMTPAHVRFPTLWPFVPSFTLVVGKVDNFSPCPHIFLFQFLHLLFWQRSDILVIFLVFQQQ